jgi:hypothetical protein
MKKQILILALSLTALTARAGHEGPQAAPVPPPEPILAQMVTAGGMPGPGNSPRAYVLNIMSNGKVMAITEYPDHTKAVALARLESATLKKLKALVEQTAQGELVPANPDEPGCFDAPSTTYYAIHASGEKVAVAGDDQCKQLHKANANSADYTIQQILNGLRSLAVLQ